MPVTLWGQAKGRQLPPEPGPKGPHPEIRPLGNPTIKDRVAQMAVKMVNEPLFEISNCSYGFKPKRNGH
ncbi:hypothetical protein M3182_18965 [Mesobacillus maritimus]|uniref:hypothetical protein n=1 Tax=Mesobacillus maritimus TaxID=1643336 RepID=UPI002041CCDE|nr:hypothetical protein [Mesobacillus maritimus]MCM3587811.1 hypothetical protein [Mesobacillus maritimus]